MERGKKNKTIIAIVFAVIAVAGIGVHYISNASARTLKDMVTTMDGMAVNLNFDKSKAIYDGKDSVFISMPNKKLTIYVDSTSCSGCFIGHMIEYYEVNNILKSKDAELLVVLHPKQNRSGEILSRLRHERFPFWCIVDEAGEFVSKNPDIPDNQLLHTFTLDNKNKVLLVGDPTKNPKIMELLLRVL